MAAIHSAFNILHIASVILQRAFILLHAAFVSLHAVSVLLHTASAILQAASINLTVIDKANSIAATAPAEYKITPELVAQAGAAAAAIAPERAERDVIGGTHSGTTTQLSDLFATARNQLHTLDDLIEGDADDDNSEFVRDYFIMRRTVDHKGRQKSDPDTTTAQTV